MQIHLSIHAHHEPGTLSTRVHARVYTMDSTELGELTTTVHDVHRELIWDAGQDQSVHITSRDAVQLFCVAAGLSDPF